MGADILCMRVLLVSPAASLRNLLGQGVDRASVPAEVLEAQNDTAAQQLIARGIDLVFLDGDMSDTEKAMVCRAARHAKERPFVIAVGNQGTGADVDGSVGKPATAEDAQKIADDCIRARLPIRALIVDDSSTMRAIVRKILLASRFPLEVSDIPSGPKAVEELRDDGFDIVFLDCSMPRFDGFEILSEVRQLQLRVAVVMMSSTDNPSVAERAQAAGAAAFLRKPFFPADVDAALYRIHNIDAPVRAG
jgi:CheY-like chemotaxis protein